MTTFGKQNIVRWAAIGCAALSAAAVLTVHAPVARADDDGAMKIKPEAREAKTVFADLNKARMKVNKLIDNGKVLGDEEKRTAVAEKAIPAIQKQDDLVDEFLESVKSDTSVPKAQMPGLQQQFAAIKLDGMAMLYLFGDKPTVEKADGMAKSDETAQEVQGKSVQLRSQWMGAGTDVAKEAKVADAIEELDTAHPTSTPLTALTYKMAGEADSSDLKDRLTAIVTDKMKTAMATQIKQMAAGQAKLKALEGKPMEVVGKTVGGEDFTSAKYKGKVVLVDFWATWCGPCVAGLPEVKETYAKYHEKGLEIVGVSNDYTADALTSFTASHDMPWVQLLNSEAAGNHQWNPLTLGYGINGIPTMFLIDKKGICRTITARANMQTMIPKLLAE